MSLRHGVLLVLVGVLGLPVAGQPPRPSDPRTVAYHLSFPEPEHRWLQVEAVFPQLGAGPLSLQMSSASPGRYARHEFAKNIFDVQIFDAQDRAVAFTRPDAHRWDVADHGGTVRVSYRVYGDRVDGTYLAVDSTHAHMNMPATLMWARGLEDRPVYLELEQPPGASWAVATQLFPTDDPFAFTAPNLQYLMDSPAEFSDFDLRSFVVSDPATPANQPTFRLAVHHEGELGAVDGLAADVEQIVKETVAVFGEFPVFETNTYTFIADYLPYASADAMEHRNSAVLTSTGRFDRPHRRVPLLESVAHEFFHVWNVERIRPQSLEPFDFTDANVSGDLWLAEGFTNYYGVLLTLRSGIADLRTTLGQLESTVNTVLGSPGRQVRTAVEMSQLAPFTDAAAAIDRTNWDNTFISYYNWGEAIGLGLDLTLRGRSNGAVSLDDYMQAMWRRFGKPGGSAPGLVDVPYTRADARTVLAEVSGDRAFADDFFARFVEGHEVPDYVRLLARAGLVLRVRWPGRAWLGEVSLDSGMRVLQSTPFGSPLHEAGVDRDDVVRMLDNRPVSSRSDVDRILETKQPGDTVAVGFRRRGEDVVSSVTLGESTRVDLVAVETTDSALTPEQEAFREGWLGSQQ